MTTAQAISAFPRTEQRVEPPRPDLRPMTWPATRQSSEELLRHAARAPFSALNSGDALCGVRRIAAALEAFPGDTWQQRWFSADCDFDGKNWIEVLGGPWTGVSGTARRKQARDGLATLLCLDVIRPGYTFLHAARCIKTYDIVRGMRAAEFVRRAVDHGQRNRYSSRMMSDALLVISKIMLHTGCTPAEITCDDVLEYRQVTLRSSGRCDGAETAWDLLTRLGGFPTGTVPLRHKIRKGRMSPAEIIGSYNIRCDSVREVLVRYLDERATTLDYTSLRQLAYQLGKVFWKDLETHHSGIDSLALADDVAAAWRGRVQQAYTFPWATLIPVRAFYLDIAHRATTEAYWARWACRSPVTDTSGVKKHSRQASARMHQRIRSLAPHFPRLLREAEKLVDFESGLLAVAQQADAGAHFSYRDRDYERVALTTIAPVAGRTWTERVSVRALDTRTRIDQTQREDSAFWSWAVVNTLYYTGIRLEELSELTSTALTLYRPVGGGRAVPLLQIAPSKTDAERVLVVPPELAHVLARIKARVRGDGDSIPAVIRYDHYERTLSEPLPFLFQWQQGTQHRVISPGAIGAMLSDLLRRAAISDVNGKPIHISPHDFRRLFATETLAGGLPIHIVAKLLGHASVVTTESYAAVYPEDVMRRFQGFLARRRSLRPSEEYREPTDAEWEDFRRHFEQRKVELGTCGRGYGTSCAHEHACIRCPMLRVDPDQRGRLEEIIANLKARLVEARKRGWHGDIEGIEVSVAAAEEKLSRLRPVVNLGMPTP